MSYTQYSDTLIGQPGLAQSFEAHDMQRLIHSHGIYDKREMDWYTKFSRIPIIDPYDQVTVTKEYLFFTKPDLHLINTTTGKVANNLKYYSFFVDVVDRYRAVCEQLQMSSCIGSVPGRISTSNNPFATLLSNTVKSELELPDLESDNDQETGINSYGTKITYRGNSYTSDQDLSFSLEFEDNKYLEVYMFFKIYDEYCRLKNLGLLDLDYSNSSNSDIDDTRWINYIKHKILHDQMSVYKIVTGEDGMTILHFSKYTGIFPTGAPRSSFSSMNNYDGQKHQITFKAQFVKDMDPIILSEFNRIALTSRFTNREDLPLFNPDIGRVDGTWSSMPYIYRNMSATSQVDKMMRYQLRWKV